VDLGVPDRDAGVEHGVAEREEQHHVLVEAVAIAAGHPGGEQRPVAGRCLGSRAIGPVLGHGLAAVGEVRAEVADLVDLVQVLDAARHRRRLRPELVRRRQRERDDEAPVRRQERLRRPIDAAQRLPARGIVQPFRTVDRRVAGVVGIRRPAVQVTELVGAVGVAGGEHGLAGGVADAGGCCHAGRAVERIEAEIAQRRVETAALRREQIREGAMRRVADRAGLVGQRTFLRGSAQRAAEAGAVGPAIVGGPRVEHAGVDDGQRPRGHRRRHPDGADRLEQRSVPAQHRVVRRRRGRRAIGNAGVGGRGKADPDGESENRAGHDRGSLKRGRRATAPARMVTVDGYWIFRSTNVTRRLTPPLALKPSSSWRCSPV
jgi:hypothetical protein